MAKAKGGKAKLKAKARGGGNGRLVVRSRMAGAIVASPQDNQRVRYHLNMVLDPCHATIGPTAYRGRDGFVTRLMRNWDTITPTGVAIMAYWPKANRIYSNAMASDTTAFSLNFYDATKSDAGPGAAFLGTNAAETRVVGACIQTDYVGTELNRQGYVTRGVVPMKAVSGTLTCQQLRQMLQEFSRTPDAPLETKWVPSPVNEDYYQVPATAPTIDSDDNCIIHVFTGFGDGSLNFTNRIIQIVEWLPFYGLGIITPNPSTPDPVGGLERVRTALSKLGDWWVAGTRAYRSAIQMGHNVKTGVGYLQDARKIGKRAMFIEGVAARAGPVIEEVI